MHDRDAIPHLPVAEPLESDTRPTPFAMAVVPPSIGSASPDSVESAIDHRIDRLLAENLALMVERAQLNTNMKTTHDRSNALLAEARKAKKLVREYFRTKRILEEWTAPNDEVPLGVARDEFTAARDALESWALETL